MKKTSLKVLIEIRIKSVTCPNIRLDPSKWVHLRISLLGTYLRSRLLRAQFPLQVEEKMRAERTFPLCNNPNHLFSALIGERLCIELVQLYQLGSKVLGLFDTELNDIIFESPHVIKDKEIRTEHHTMVLRTTHHFPGIANPHVNAAISVRLIPVYDSALEISRDGGYNLTLGLKGSEHPDYQAALHEPTLNATSHWSERTCPIRTCQRMAISRNETPKIQPIKRQIFCVRHVDDKLIGRTPSSEPFNHNTAHTSNFTLTGRAKSPWYRSTSQMETVSSLLRRKPKIIRCTHLWEPDQDTKCAWCLSDQYQTSDASTLTVDTLQAHQGPNANYWESDDLHVSHQQNDGIYHQKRDTDNYCVNHNSEICTLCQLYYEYFGQYYPMHTVL